jgi:hypothetical protein
VTTTLDDVDGGEVERLARALQAQLHPLTGGRATGTALVTRTGGPITLPPNTYAIPVNATSDTPSENKTLITKVAFNPATVEAHNQGGDWIVGATPTQVAFVANAGGLRFNSIKTGYKLRFDPPVPGLEPTATVDADWSGGVDGIVKAAAIYEDVDDPRSIFDTGVGVFPAIVIAWNGSEVADGRTTGVSQGRTRANRNTRSYYEDFSIFVVVADAGGANQRRKQGQRITEAVRNCITDHSMNDDGESLVAWGTGVEVMQVAKAAQSPQVWVYVVRARLSTTVTRVDTRTWQPWLKSKVEASLPADPHLDDNGDPVPPHQPNELPLIAPKPDGTPEGIKVNMPQSP